MNQVEIGPAGEKGQGLFARQFIRKGGTLMTLPYPTMMSIDSESLHNSCYGCLAPAETILDRDLKSSFRAHSARASGSFNLTACFGCLEVWYCGRACQTRAWKEFHQYECEYFNNLDMQTTSAEARVVIRLLLLKRNGLVTPETWKEILNLHSNEQQLSCNARESHHLAANEIVQLLEPSITRSRITQLLAIVHANSFRLEDDQNNNIGLHLHPPLSKANHSCRPNARFIEHDHGDPHAWTCFPADSELLSMSFGEVVALEDIQRGDEVTISYLSKEELTLPFKMRREKLHQTWFFWCRCARCRKEERAHRLQWEHRSHVAYGRPIRAPHTLDRNLPLDAATTRRREDVVVGLPGHSQATLRQVTRSTVESRAGQLRLTHHYRRSKILSNATTRE